MRWQTSVVQGWRANGMAFKSNITKRAVTRRFPPDRGQQLGPRRGKLARCTGSTLRTPPAGVLDTPTEPTGTGRTPHLSQHQTIVVQGEGHPWSSSWSWVLGISTPSGSGASRLTDRPCNSRSRQDRLGRRLENPQRIRQCTAGLRSMSVDRLCNDVGRCLCRHGGEEPGTSSSSSSRLHLLPSRCFVSNTFVPTQGMPRRLQVAPGLEYRRARCPTAECISHQRRR